MAMKKAEMENHKRQYQMLMAEAQEAERTGSFREAVANALASWQYVDGMMQYERRYESKDFESILAIDLTLKYAPLLFDRSSLDQLEGLLKSFRRIEKNTSDSLRDRLAAARQLMWDGHRLWNHLERNPGSRQDGLRQLLGGDQDRWRVMVEEWESMGLIRRESEGRSNRLTLVTRMDEKVSAKCSSCGHVVEASKSACLAGMTCPNCNVVALFVILSSESGKE